MKAADTSALLYHDLRFDRLLNMISFNSDFVFGGKNIMIIMITPYLKLTDRSDKKVLEEDEFNDIAQRFKMEHPKEELKAYQFTNEDGQGEWYLKTESRKAAVFTFYFIKQCEEKIIFKNPKNLDKLTEDDKRKRLILKYPYPYQRAVKGVVKGSSKHQRRHNRR